MFGAEQRRVRGNAARELQSKCIVDRHQVALKSGQARSDAGGTASGSAPQSASAQTGDTYDQFNDRFRVYLGGFWPDVDSKIGINGDFLPPGPPVDIEDTLGVEDGDGVIWGGVQWHISRRNSLELEFFDLNRDGGVAGTFSPPIQIGDTIIEAGAINTKYDTAIGRLTYGYSIIRNERADVQLKAGLHLAKLEAGIQFAGAICDGIPIPPAGPSTRWNCATARIPIRSAPGTGRSAVRVGGTRPPSTAARR